MAKRLSEEEKARRERIQVNDRFAASGYIPVPCDDCLDGSTHQPGKRCDDTEQYRHEIPLSALREDQRRYFAGNERGAKEARRLAREELDVRIEARRAAKWEREWEAKMESA